MSAIERCRTAALGGHVEQCDTCGHLRIAFNSCRNRHCPKCQSLVRAQWLDNRQADHRAATARLKTLCLMQSTRLWKVVGVPGAE